MRTVPGIPKELRFDKSVKPGYHNNKIIAMSGDPTSPVDCRRTGQERTEILL
jgi:hypothetical protein